MELWGHDFVKSLFSPPLVGGDERGEGKDMIESSHLPPPPEPSPVKGEGILDFLRVHQIWGRDCVMSTHFIRVL